MNRRLPLVVLATVAVVAALVATPAQAQSPSSGPDTLSIERLYQAYFERDPDPDGLEYWSERRDRGMALVRISAQFAASAEFRARYGQVDDRRFVELVYDNVLDRQPDSGGLAYWTDQLDRGRSRGWVMLGFSDSAEFKSRTGLVGDPYQRPVGELPRGGTSLFPEYRIVAEYGHPGVPVLGVLGEKGPAEAARQVQLRALDYELRGGTPVLPTFEIIATVAQASPGADGLYSSVLPPEQIRPWLDAVRTVDGYVILDLQPGRARFIDQARRYESLLVEPDVGLALDPEWAVGPGEAPGGGTIGSVTAAEINEVSAYLAGLVEREGLPEKLLVIHQFEPSMVIDPQNVVDRPGVAIVFHADGFGGRAAKLADYFDLIPDRFPRGLKLFFDEDVNLFSPAEVLALDPPPDMITYQ
ncbi:MAG TPA: DUF4214 domain-containing protein [Acidimicrobiales bacterium]|nr:DUF4214 domain-containing protein [Acidimicrobiales bacterium]